MREFFREQKERAMTQVHPSESSHAPGAIGWGIVGFAVLLAPGCATTKDLDTLRAQLNDQVAAVRSDAAQSRQAVDALKTDVMLLKSLGVAVDSLKSRVDVAQATLQGLQIESDSHRTTLGNLRVDFKEFRVAHEGVAKETDRLRMSVGSLEQGMMHQLQMEVTLAQERIKQLEQVIESLRKSSPAEKGKGGTATPKL
jgi:chromosome segregation ATPase